MGDKEAGGEEAPAASEESVPVWMSKRSQYNKGGYEKSTRKKRTSSEET